MSQNFIAVSARATLEHHGLDSFEALWALELEAVDDTNTRRGGWSSVYRLELADPGGQTQAFYLKRQCNHLTRNLSHPLGEPTFAREFRAIQQFARLGIPALETAFFGQRVTSDGQQAILLTRALDTYRPLNEWFADWPVLDRYIRRDIILASAALVRRLHEAGRIHNCLYPKHVFVKLDGDGAAARLIDLEKTRSAWLGRRDRVRDLETLHRRSQGLRRTERLRFLLSYLGVPRVNDEARRLIVAITRRQHGKPGRGQ